MPSPRIKEAILLLLQAMMDDIFGDMINDCIVIIYMDDIFLFATDEKKLTENTKKVLTCL